MFNLGLYPAGYKTFFDKTTPERKITSPLLTAGILLFLKENDIEEFWLDENE